MILVTIVRNDTEGYLMHPVYEIWDWFPHVSLSTNYCISRIWGLLWCLLRVLAPMRGLLWFLSRVLVPGPKNYGVSIKYFANVFLQEFFYFKGAEGPQQSETPELAIARENGTNIEHYDEVNDTTLPFDSHKDYLLSYKPVKYSLLLTLRQELNRGRFLVFVRAAKNGVSRIFFSIIIQNRTVAFYTNNSVLGLFDLANRSSWQKLIVGFNHKEISLTQECVEFSFLSLPNKPELDDWEQVTVTVQTDSAQDDSQVCKVDRK